MLLAGAGSWSGDIPEIHFFRGVDFPSAHCFLWSLLLQFTAEQSTQHLIQMQILENLRKMGDVGQQTGMLVRNMSVWGVLQGWSSQG